MQYFCESGKGGSLNSSSSSWFRSREVTSGSTVLSGITVVLVDVGVCMEIALHSDAGETSRGRVREYHYVLKMTSRHFQHVLFFTIDIFSTCCFDDTFSTCCFWRHFQHVLFLTTLSARTVVTFQHGAIRLVLPTTFSARSHLIGFPDYIFSTKPFHWKQFQHGHLWLAGSLVIFSTEHFRWLALIATHHDNTGCIQQQQWYFTHSKGNTI